MNRTTLRASASAAAVLSLTLAACGAANEGGGDDNGSDGSLSGTLNGAGASSQEAAVQAWTAGFQGENEGATVNYDPIGSGDGRTQFISGGSSFAGSDAYLDDDELTEAKARCSDGEIVTVPSYISPVAVVYNLEGVDKLQLSANTIGQIFEGKITTWNDDAIAADNPDADLPASNITPVHRSDPSGTTENFTEYLDAASEGGWSKGVVEEWPIKGGEAAAQTSGVVSAVQGGNGTIGYADLSQAGELSKVSVKVGDTFTEPTPEAAAKSLEAATPVKGRGETDLSVDLDRQTTEEGVYPIVLASYMIACQTYEDAAEAELVKGWLAYITSEAGQKESADNAGSAPISGDFASKIAEAIDTIKGA